VHRKGSSEPESKGTTWIGEDGHVAAVMERPARYWMDSAVERQ